MNAENRAGILPRNYPENYRKAARDIIGIILEKPRITMNELAKQVGITEDGVKYHLDKPRKEGIIRRVGGRKGGKWEVTGNVD